MKIFIISLKFGKDQLKIREKDDKKDPLEKYMNNINENYKSYM